MAEAIEVADHVVEPFGDALVIDPLTSLIRRYEPAWTGIFVCYLTLGCVTSRKACTT